MANVSNATIIQTTNTFEVWRIRDNLMANDVNEIARGEFTKPVGNVTFTVGKLVLANSTGTMLDVTADARVSGKVSLKNFEQDGGASYLYTATGDAQFTNASGTLLVLGNTKTRFLYNNNFISVANINANGFIETTGTYANANLIMNVGGVLTVRSAANSSNVYVIGNVSVSNVATIGNARITLSNTTTANILTLHANTTGATANFANVFTANSNTTNAIVGVLNVQTRANVSTANIATLEVATLTVQNPISGPTEADSSSYRLRVAQTTRGDGSFGVYQGSSSNGNAWLTFSSTSNVWRVTANSTEGTYQTLITVANVSDSVATTSSVNVASLTGVKTAYDTATSAYSSANNAANTVRVSVNTGSTIAKANGINFNNTSTVLVTVAAGINGNANISFAVDNTNPTLIGPQGIQGIQGAIGTQGVNGYVGSDGAQGIQGITGSSGGNGAQGIQGLTGAQGTNGSNGSQGATGTNGTQGATGIQGTTGATGTQGTQGIQGVQGVQGRQGTTGVQGSTGPSTAINASNYSSGTYYPVMVAFYGSNYTPYIAYTTLNYASGTLSATDFAATSDARLKNVVGLVDNAMTIVDNINAVRFTWNEDGKELGYESLHKDGIEVGLLAQEVKAVLPEAVHTDEKGYMRVSYDRLVPILIEAVKELSARIKVLEGK